MLGALTQQARLQLAAVEGETPPHELLPVQEGKGFALLPEPSVGDVMFDFEGDPFWTPAQGLMFLTGLLFREGDGWRYEPIWAHDRDGEKAAFERLVDLLTARLAEFPDMHVYHYSAAEPSVVKQLMAQHATREFEVDDLLRRGVFVDLLTITRQALRAGVRSYSLKQTERLAGFARVADMGTGSEAVLGYERWAEQRRSRRARGHRGLQRGGLPRHGRPARLAARGAAAGSHRARPDRIRRAGRGERRGGDGAVAAPRGAHRRRAPGLGALARRRAAGVLPPRGSTRLVAALRLPRDGRERPPGRQRDARRAGAGR